MMIAVLIEQQVREFLDWGFAAALSIVLLAVALAVYVASSTRLVRRESRMRPRNGRTVRVKLWQLALYAWCALVFAFLMLPLVDRLSDLVQLVVAISQFPPPGWSLRWYHAYVAGSCLDRRDASAASKSPTCAAILATVLGTMLAFSIVRGRYPGRELVNQHRDGADHRADDRLFDRRLQPVRRR